MSAQNGTDYKGSFAIASAGTAIESISWQDLGMLKTKSVDSKYATTDTTADSTPGNGVSAMATRLSHDLSIDAIAYDDAAYNQKTLKAHFYDPSIVTGNKPEVWFKLEHTSGESYIGYFLMSGWTNDEPDADAVTWKMAAVCQGKLHYSPGV